MKISSQTLVFVTIALVLAFAVPLKAQESQQDYLDVHNRARRAVGVGPIRWHADVAAYARQYALRMRGDCRLIHSGGRYGENLAGSTGDLSGADPVRLWVEKKDYFYNSNTCRSGKACGHYTQVVWRNSVWVSGLDVPKSGVTVVELSLFAAMILLRLELVFLTDSYELT
ncbi:unnamed protein product [Brassica rapa subsp. narinosa]